MTEIILITIMLSIAFGLIQPLESHHLKSRGEGYLEHMLVALKAAYFCLLAAICLVGHSIVPDRLTRAGSANLDKAHSVINRE